MRRALGLALSLVLCAGCGRNPEKAVVADVGDYKITVAELIEFQKKLPQSLRSKKQGIEAQKDYLQSLIDKYIMLMEAKARGLDEDSLFLQRFDREVKRRLRRELIKREVWPKVKVSEEEMRQYYEEHKLGKALRVRHIRVATEEQAKKVMEELKKGRPFEELVRKYSIDSSTVAKGGDLGKYFRRDEAAYPIGDAVWDLKPGEISGPMKMGNFYEIIQVVDEKPVPFEDWRPKLHRALWRYKFRVELDAFIENLRKKLHVKLNEENLDLLLAKEQESGGRPPVVSEDEKKLPLYTFDGGQITIGDYLKAFGRAKGRPEDRRSLLNWVNYLLPDELLVAFAYKKKIDRIPEVAAWIEKKREELLVETLRRKEVKEKVKVSDQEVREEYERHKMVLYYLPEERDLTEILVPTREQAEELLRRIKAGEDIEELAAKYTTRKGLKKLKGKFHMHPFERPVYGSYYDTVMNAPVGKLMGPVKVEKGYAPSDTGYAIFKVTSVVPKRPEPFKRAKRRVRAMVRYKKESQRFGEFMQELREKYRDRVHIYGDKLYLALEQLAKI
ncbi:MAG: hypothetical protein DRP99_02270 [Candidatus Latescibacterota bacterium]|nr:MAG: hypothetical protein DRP99_02270 [Candidatus Latescibacterota bacterium]